MTQIAPSDPGPCDCSACAQIGLYLALDRIRREHEAIIFPREPRWNDSDQRRIETMTLERYIK